MYKLDANAGAALRFYVDELGRLERYVYAYDMHFAAEAFFVFRLHSAFDPAAPALDALRNGDGSLELPLSGVVIAKYSSYSDVAVEKLSAAVDGLPAGWTLRGAAFVYTYLEDSISVTLTWVAVP